MSGSQDALIVVGVDGSPSSIKALEWGIGQAALTSASVEAVTAWHFPNSYGSPLPDSGDYPGTAAETLDKAIATARNARTGPGEAEVEITTYGGAGPAGDGGRRGGRPPPPGGGPRPGKSCSPAPATPASWWWATAATAGSARPC